jgi:phosphoribosyl-AMP cyclohydrolase
MVLMLAYMNRKALAKSLSTGFMHYWSRSRRKLWMKGEVSGHTQRILEVRVNCEENSLLFIVEQIGGCCHMGYRTCFYRAIKGKNLKFVEKKLFEPESIYGKYQGKVVDSK